MKKEQEALPEFDTFTDLDLGKYIKTLRGPFSQREFSDALKVDPSVVDNWEHGRTQPQPRMIRRMLEHYARWAIQEQLPMTARHAAEAAGLKKYLTTPPRPSI